MNNDDERARLIARQIRELVKKLQVMGRDDLLLQAITVPTLEQLRTEAARGTLRRLIVKRDGRLFLEGSKANGNDSNNMVEVQLSPVHRAVYLLFLRHEEGIEFKRLSEYHDELLSIYDRICPEGDQDKKRETVERLTNPLDNAINEKCPGSSLSSRLLWTTTPPATTSSAASQNSSILHRHAAVTMVFWRTGCGWRL